MDEGYSVSKLAVIVTLSKDVVKKKNTHIFLVFVCGRIRIKFGVGDLQWKMLMCYV